MILGGAKASLAHVVIFLSLQLKGVALTRNCTFWVVREKNESEQDFKRAWDDFRAVNSNKVRFCFRWWIEVPPLDAFTYLRIWIQICWCSLQLHALWILLLGVHVGEGGSLGEDVKSLLQDRLTQFQSCWTCPNVCQIEKSDPSLGARILWGLKSSLNLSIQIICGICDIGADTLHGLAWLTMLGNG